MKLLKWNQWIIYTRGGGSISYDRNLSGEFPPPSPLLIQRGENMATSSNLSSSDGMIEA